MLNVKKSVAAIMAALSLAGAVSVPALSSKIINPTVTEATSIYYESNITPGTRTVKANTNFRKRPGYDYAVACSIKKESKITVTKVAATSDGTWYYSKYDNAWVHSSHLK